MKALIGAALSLGFGLSACQSVPASTPDRSLAEDLDEMLAWFPGVYDNFEQIETERESDFAPALRHRHLNHTFYPVEISGIPGRQLYAQQYQHHDPADLYRQRIYSFE
ncbi:MAG: CpcT/CpeT family chromophore lyase, partial [Pseudomonadota bacterium]